MFSLPLTSQAYLPRPLPFSPVADNRVSYFTTFRKNKKRTSSCSMHRSIHLSGSLPGFSVHPAVLPDKLDTLLSRELVLSVAPTLKGITIQPAAVTAGINQHSTNHLDLINFQFPLRGLHLLCIPPLHEDESHFPLACQLKQCQCVVTGVNCTCLYLTFGLEAALG